MVSLILHSQWVSVAEQRFEPSEFVTLSTTTPLWIQRLENRSIYLQRAVKDFSSTICCCSSQTISPVKKQWVSDMEGQIIECHLHSHILGYGEEMHKGSSVIDVIGIWLTADFSHNEFRVLLLLEGGRNYGFLNC